MTAQRSSDLDQATPSPTPDEYAEILEAAEAVSPIQRIVFEHEDLACGPSGATGPWRLTAAAGGRQLNDTDFQKPLDLDWLHFSIDVMRRVLAEDGIVHFDLTHLRGLPALLDGEGPFGDAITAHELRWLRRRWDRGEGSIVFWTEVEYREDGAWGRQVEPPWEWDETELNTHVARVEDVRANDEQTTDLAA